MRRYLSIILISAFTMASCEEIIDVDLKTSEPVLVAEATILLDSLAVVKLAYTSSYFDTEKAKIEDYALVSISDDSGRSEVLEYMGEGVYRGNIIRGKENTEYSLSISAGDRSYNGSSYLNSKPEILILEYEKLDIPHYSEETIYSLMAIITDNPYSDNYYMLRYYRNGEMINDYYSIFSDRYLQADTIVYSDYKLDFYKTDTVKVELYAIDRGVYNYFNLVNDVLFSAMSSSTPFNPESNISGGILGYFMAASFDSDSIIIY
ncbi:MAG: DUF4249 family protein [Bacteroidales bacterium]|nr:DUF4249 family protein [Bacteroidales bacterium]